jgi:hypothetical protein
VREYATRNSVGECLIGIVFASDLTSTLVDLRSRGALSRSAGAFITGRVNVVRCTPVGRYGPRLLPA